MKDLVKRKNLRAKKGKKQWKRNIDVSQLEEQLQQQNQQKFKKPITSKPQKKQPLLSFSVEGQSKNQVSMYETAEYKDRFKKKDTYNPSKYEIEKLKLWANKPKQEAIETEPSKQTPAEPEDLNVWDEQNPSITPKNDNKISHVIIPHSGLSYNPSTENYQKYIAEIIQLEGDKKKEKKSIHDLANSVPIQKRITKRPHPKHQKQLEEYLKQQDLRQKKRALNEKHELKKIRRELKVEEARIRAKLEKKKKEQEEQEQLKQSLGIVKTGPKLGKVKYQMQHFDDLKLENELTDSLRTVHPTNSLIREQFDSVYRKGIIEQKNHDRKQKKNKLKAYKFKERKDSEEYQEQFLKPKSPKDTDLELMK